MGGFGLARTAGTSEISSDQQLLGTFGYLAPEYVESGKPTTKSDVYALGVVLLELITGFSKTDKRVEEKSLLGWVPNQTKTSFHFLEHIHKQYHH